MKSQANARICLAVVWSGFSLPYSLASSLTYRVSNLSDDTSVRYSTVSRVNNSGFLVG